MACAVVKPYGCWSKGPDRIEELIAWGAKFDKIGKRFAYTREAAHSQAGFSGRAGMPPAMRWFAR